MKTTLRGSSASCRIFIALLFAFSTWIAASAQYYASLETSSTSGNHDLIAGTVSNPIVDVYGMVATFSGDFTDIDEETIGVDWSGSWLLAGNGTGAHLWDIFTLEDGATLTFWRTDEDPTTGYGKVLELVGSTVVGELVLDDLGKRKNPFVLESIKFLQHPQALAIYPQPCSQSLHCEWRTGGFPADWDLISAVGEKVASVHGSSILDCTLLPEGLYWVSTLVDGQHISKAVSIVHEK